MRRDRSRCPAWRGYDHRMICRPAPACYGEEAGPGAHTWVRPRQASLGTRPVPATGEPTGLRPVLYRIETETRKPP